MSSDHQPMECLACYGVEFKILKFRCCGDACVVSVVNLRKSLSQVKRLWERAVYLAQRNMAVEPSLVMLKALKPIFGHWVAELAQIAAHAETLHSILEKRFNDAVLSDLTVFRRGLSLVATT